jgi:hypothetical protein
MSSLFICSSSLSIGVGQKKLIEIYLAGAWAGVAGVAVVAAALCFDFAFFLFAFFSAFVGAAVAAGVACAAGAAFAAGAAVVPWASATEANVAATNATTTFFIQVFLGVSTPAHRVVAINGLTPEPVDIIPYARRTRLSSILAEQSKN